MEFYPELVKHQITGNELTISEQNLNFFAKTNKMFSEKRADARSLERKVAFAKIIDDDEEQPAPVKNDDEDPEMQDHNMITELLKV